MQLVIEYLDGTKDVMNTDFKDWSDFQAKVNGMGRVYSLDFVTDKGPRWVPSTAIKRVYPK